MSFSKKPQKRVFEQEELSESLEFSGIIEANWDDSFCEKPNSLVQNTNEEGTLDRAFVVGSDRSVDPTIGELESTHRFNLESITKSPTKNLVIESKGRKTECCSTFCVVQ